MITHVHIQNFRSFVDAQVDLQPFSLVVGANGSGKSNFLRFFEVVTQVPARTTIHNIASNVVGVQEPFWIRHINNPAVESSFLVEFDGGKQWRANEAKGIQGLVLSKKSILTGKSIKAYNLVADKISGIEQVQPDASVGPTGKGTTQVLDMLKNGDREDLFDQIEAHFRRYVPEVEKLSLRTVKEGFKQIQVREKGLQEPTPGPELSEGTRLILAVLTIIHQENPPPIILLEDIDRGMHPRLFEYIAPLMKDIAVRTGVNILATTHNPYLVDAFQDDKKAVIIVEKQDGASTLSTLEQRLEGLNYDEVNPEDMPLGALWFSGLVGGTPAKISHGVGAKG